MTASEVIEQIKSLSPEERAEVEAFVQQLPKSSDGEVSPEMETIIERNFDQYDDLFRKLAQ